VAAIAIPASTLFIGAADALSSDAWEWSDAIQVSREIRPQLQTMLRSSALFRAQYRRIADSRRVFVGVRVNAGLVESTIRARSIIRRYASGLIVAVVQLPPGRHEELIAHEFEHIIEQLDGQGLQWLARARTGEAWYTRQDTIETRRAADAGRAVLNQLRRRVVASNKAGSSKIVE
jgi:hypothetical protein